MSRLTAPGQQQRRQRCVTIGLVADLIFEVSPDPCRWFWCCGVQLIPDVGLIG